MSRFFVTAALLPALLAACSPDQRQPTATVQRPTPPTAAPAVPADTAPAPTPAPVAGPAALDSAFLLRRGFAGPFRLNMKEAALQAAVPAASLHKTTRRIEDIEYPVYEYRAPGSAATTSPLVLELVGDEEEGYRLWRVQVPDPRYRTAEALGVGSSYGEVRTAYGIQTVERTEAGLVAVSERQNMSWVLNAKGLPKAKQLRKDDIPPGTLITGVILFR